MPGSHGAREFSGKREEKAGREGLLRVKSGAPRQDKQGLRLLSQSPVSWQPGGQAADWGAISGA